MLMYTTQCLLLTESVRTQNPGGSQVQLQLHADIICYYCAGGHSEEPGSAGLGGRRRQRPGEAVIPARSPRHARQDSRQGFYSYSSLSAFGPDQCVVGIRIGFNQCWGSGSVARIRMFLGLIDPDPDPLVRAQRYVSGSGSFYHQAKIVRKTKP
jgi:hypothetical protein